ncbi:hypothetical protein TorRG33x02_266420, partial [Trema orientale]
MVLLVILTSQQLNISWLFTARALDSGTLTAPIGSSSDTSSTGPPADSSTEHLALEHSVPPPVPPVPLVPGHPMQPINP